NTNTDNSLVNALETQFDATTSGFKITTRLLGPLGNIDLPSEQGGIMFGPDQDHFVKFVAVAQPAPNNQVIQFFDEQGSGVHTLATTYVNPGSFANIETLDLQMIGDAATGKITAFYSVNGGAGVQLAATVTIAA